MATGTAGASLHCGKKKLLVSLFAFQCTEQSNGFSNLEKNLCNSTSCHLCHSLSKDNWTHPLPGEIQPRDQLQIQHLAECLGDGDGASGCERLANAAQLGTKSQKKQNKTWPFDV